MSRVITLHPLDDDEALGWLSGQLGRRKEWTTGELARQFGWPQGKLRRRLETWTKAGWITQRASRGKVIIEPAPDQAQPADEAMSRRAAMRLVTRALIAEVPAVETKPVRAPLTAVAAALLLATALGLAGVGLVMNARFAASFGQTAEASLLLALIGLAVDVLAVALPSVASQLWARRTVLAAGIAWAIWAAALSMTLLAAAGFASTQIGDAVAGRAKIAGERSALVERIDRMRRERAAIAEARAAAAIEVDLQQAQPQAQAVWKVTAGCRDVTRASSARACAPVLEQREALAIAQHRDGLDRDLREAEARLAFLPAIAVADPQAATAAEIVARLSGGNVKPSAEDVASMRTIGLALAPSFAGLIAMLALSLGRRRRA